MVRTKISTEEKTSLCDSSFLGLYGDRYGVNHLTLTLSLIQTLSYASAADDF